MHDNRPLPLPLLWSRQRLRLLHICPPPTNLHRPLLLRLPTRALGASDFARRRAPLHVLPGRALRAGDLALL